MKNIKELFFSVFFPISVVTICACLTAGCGQAEAKYKVKDDAFVSASSVPVSDNSDADSGSDRHTKSDSNRPEILYVYICGAVTNPGVYELPADSRVYQLIEAAGGLLSDADTKVLNQAEPLTDGMQITVYTQEEAKEMPISTETPSASNVSGKTEDAKVNLNTAGEDSLMTLSGIGEARAKAIIEFREKNGNYTSIEDIMQIEGIKEKLFEKIKDQIEV